MSTLRLTAKITTLEMLQVDKATLNSFAHRNENRMFAKLLRYFA